MEQKIYQPIKISILLIVGFLIFTLFLSTMMKWTAVGMLFLGMGLRIFFAGQTQVDLKLSEFIAYGKQEKRTFNYIALGFFVLGFFVLIGTRSVSATFNVIATTAIFFFVSVVSLQTGAILFQEGYYSLKYLAASKDERQEMEQKRTRVVENKEEHKNWLKKNHEQSMEQVNLFWNNLSLEVKEYLDQRVPKVVREATLPALKIKENSKIWCAKILFDIIQQVNFFIAKSPSREVMVSTKDYSLIVEKAHEQNKTCTAEDMLYQLDAMGYLTRGKVDEIYVCMTKEMWRIFLSMLHDKTFTNIELSLEKRDDERYVLKHTSEERI